MVHRGRRLSSRRPVGALLLLVLFPAGGALGQEAPRIAVGPTGLAIDAVTPGGRLLVFGVA